MLVESREMEGKAGDRSIVARLSIFPADRFPLSDDDRTSRDAVFGSSAAWIDLGMPDMAKTINRDGK
jgi:hypothetical protein